MSRSEVGHSVKYWRVKLRDNILTPVPLAEHLIAMVPLLPGDVVLDPFYGEGAFADAYPPGTVVQRGDLRTGQDFLQREETVDWIVSNPPYSILDEVLARTAAICRRGFAYLLAVHAVTPRRIENMEALGFGLRRLHLLKVFKWYGISAFCVFERDAVSVVTYDRKVWR